MERSFRHRKCDFGLWIVLCIVCILGMYPAAASTEESFITIQYTNGDTVYQPLVILASYDIDTNNMSMYFDKTGTVASELWQYLSPCLTDNHEIMDIDISEERIVLLLADDDRSFLRIAQWDCALNDYAIVDTAFLTVTIVLDTYHDGNAVLVYVPYPEDDAKEEIWQTCNEFFLTFELLENSWYLSNFTDGQSFIADISNGGYLFDDYNDTESEYQWIASGLLPLCGFRISDLFAYVQQYNEVMPERFSLLE